MYKYEYAQVCVYLCIYKYMYVVIYACMCVCVCVCAYACVCLRASIFGTPSEVLFPIATCCILSLKYDLIQDRALPVTSGHAFEGSYDQ